MTTDEQEQEHPHELDPDRETTEAIGALAYRMRELGVPDPEWHAREFVWAMRNRGWRPTAASSQTPDWRRPHGRVADPEAARRYAAEARALIAGNRHDASSEHEWLGRSVPVWCGSCGCDQGKHRAEDTGILQCATCRGGCTGWVATTTDTPPATRRTTAFPVGPTTDDPAVLDAARATGTTRVTTVHLPEETPDAD